jgi:tight adherence protein C
MSREAGLLLVASVALALAVMALILLGARTFLRNRRGEKQEKVPLLIGFCRWPALLLVPVASGFISPGIEGRLHRTLDSNGLYPQLTPVLWAATRVVHGVMVAVTVLLVLGTDFWLLTVLAGVAGFMAGGVWLRRVSQERERQIVRELPAYLDLLTVCVEAGATLAAGARLIVAQAPATPLRSYFDRVLREVRSGRPRAEAFVHVAGVYGVESLTTLANALAHAEGAGMSLGQILRTQSGQRTAERFARAEKLAMQAPVKMLGPLIFCIFPCTFIVLAVPIVVRMLEAFQS